MALLYAAGPLAAEPIAVGDPSFENNSNGPGQWTNDLRPEWQETNGPGNGAGFEERITGFAADGLNHLGMELGHDVWQDLATTYEPATRYTLTVAVGRRTNLTSSNNSSVYELGTNENAFPVSGAINARWAADNQTFVDAPPVVLDTTEFPEVVGKPIRIMLRARGSGRSHFDHIRLESEPVASGGTPVLGPLDVSGIGQTSARIEGTVEDAGEGSLALTLFWGDEDGGENAGSWDHSRALAATGAGPFSEDLESLSPGATWFAVVRAQNSAGTTWTSPTLAFETLPAPPVVTTLAADEITATSARIGASVVSSGGELAVVTIFHGPTDGGTDAGAWAASTSLGTLTGDGHTVVSGLAPGATYHFRAFAENSSGGAWADASANFTTLAASLPAVVNLPATAVTGTSARLRGEITATGNDPPAVTIFFGTSDGGTNPAAWQFSAEVGTSSGTFESLAIDLQPETTYHFRARATNVAGSAWAAASTFATLAAQPGSATINEFHYKPGDESSLEEFIELHNPGDLDIDLAGWQLDDAISFTFPTGAILPAGGYVVVGEDPATLLARYGITAFGPWSGKLSSRGETIDLLDANGILRDRVAYGVGFPWPSGSDGGGHSVELVHHALDRGLPGSWRASGADVQPPAVFVPAGATDWKYRKGTSEASSPMNAWRGTGFSDTAWSTATAPIGYGEPNIVTELADMRFNYSSVYFRRSFVVPAGSVPERLRLRVAIDDGCVIWINGVEVDRRHVPQGELPYSAFASNHEQAWEEIIIEDADEILLGGTNVIAVHGFNTTLDSSDFVFDLELSAAQENEPTAPTPGRRNSSAYSAPTDVPPHFHDVWHAPGQPQPGEPVTIRARITDPDGVADVTLSYQLVDPGNYIRLTDASYETQWTDLPMRDDGTGGDAVAGDSIFTAVLPAGLQTNRRLVRYRIAAEDAPGNALSVPYTDDEQPNFAYYVYGELPDWSGAFRPGTTPIQTYPAETLDDLPVYTLIANGSDVIDSQYVSSADKRRFPGTFVYDGEVYDHIEFRNRGEASTYRSGKNKWRFYFNRARRLPAKNNLGLEYDETWKQFSGDACASPWAALHRGSAGIEEAASYKIYQLAGVASPHTHYYHFRVVRGPQETPPAGTTVNDPIGTADGQYAGDFWGLYLAIEPVRGNFLDERGLPAGNVYKIEGNNGDKKEQAPGQPVDSADWNAFRDAHVSANPDESWWRANMDMDAYYTFQALNRLVGNVDLRGGFNHYFYHRSSDGRWVPIPWDLDMMFIAKSHWSTNINGVSHPGVIHAHKSVLQNAPLALEYRNRCREILDLMAGDADPDGGHIGQLLAETSAIVHTPGGTLTWANADAAMWNLHPRTAGSDGNASGQTSHRGNFFRSPFDDDRFGGWWTRWLRSPGFSGTATHDDSLRYFVEYATDTWPGGSWSVNNGNQLGYGYQYLLSESADPDIPQKPTLSYVGEPGFPADGLSFAASAFADPQGAGTFAARQWRVAEVRAPGRFEIDALWTEITTEAAAQVKNLPSAGMMAGRTYRVRVRQQDSSGRWSHWSDPVEFSAGQAAADLVHYWNFNNPADLLAPTFGTGSSLTVTPGPATELRDDDDGGFSGENAHGGDPAGTHLRVNNPLGSSLTFHVPSTHHEALIARVETRRSGQGAGVQQWSYTINGSDFLPLQEVVVEDADPVVLEFDFRTLPETWTNPHFALRVTFEQGTGGTAGNHRFDNFTLTGTPADGANFPPEPVGTPPLVQVIEGSGPVFLDRAAWFTDPENDALVFSHAVERPDFVSVQATGDVLAISGLRRGESLLVLSADDGSNAPVDLPVRVLVHPAPHLLAGAAFSFDAWSPDEPELAYPPHMLFLQSGTDDPDSGTPLDHAYFIPHDDYASGDAGTIGFPYNNSSRTRINGLGTSGISFINTGRGRDLGGALLALDTRDAGNVSVAWTAGTVTPNSREYAIRLQYRVGLDGAFADVTDALGAPLVYHRSAEAGDQAEFPEISLPADALGQPYVQLLWRYHHVSGTSGPRDELRLDDLLVHSDSQPQPGSYAWWRSQQFPPEQQLDPLVSGPEADPDGDGRPNFMEFALLGSPLEPDGSPTSFRWMGGQTPRPGLRFQRPQNASSVTYELLSSADLESWSVVNVPLVEVVPLGDGIEEVTLADPSPDAGSPHFLRLRVIWGN